MKKIAIILEGGLVQNVLSEEPIDVTVVDYDTDGADSAEVRTVLGEDACLRGFTSEVNPEDFNAILKPNLSGEEETSLTNNSTITLTEEEKNTLMMKLAKLSSGETTEAHSGKEQEHLKSIFKKLF